MFLWNVQPSFSAFFLFLKYQNVIFLFNEVMDIDFFVFMFFQAFKIILTPIDPFADNIPDTI